MKKSELESGMILVNRGGDKRRVIGNILAGYFYGTLNSYNEDLTYKDEYPGYEDSLTIMEVYAPRYNHILLVHPDEADLVSHYYLVWKREEEKPLMLGDYPVEFHDGYILINGNYKLHFSTFKESYQELMSCVYHHNNLDVNTLKTGYRITVANGTFSGRSYIGILMKDTEHGDIIAYEHGWDHLYTVKDRITKVEVPSGSYLLRLSAALHEMTVSDLMWHTTYRVVLPNKFLGYMPKILDDRSGISLGSMTITLDELKAVYDKITSLED